MSAVQSLGLGSSKAVLGNRPVSPTGRDLSLMASLETFSRHSAYSVLNYLSPVLEYPL